jgi:hypothetical protein
MPLDPQSYPALLNIFLAGALTPLVLSCLLCTLGLYVARGLMKEHYLELVQDAQGYQVLR